MRCRCHNIHSDFTHDTALSVNYLWTPLQPHIDSSLASFFARARKVTVILAVLVYSTAPSLRYLNSLLENQDHIVPFVFHRTVPVLSEQSARQRRGGRSVPVP